MCIYHKISYLFNKTRLQIVVANVTRYIFRCFENDKRSSTDIEKPIEAPDFQPFVKQEVGKLQLLDESLLKEI